MNEKREENSHFEALSYEHVLKKRFAKLLREKNEGLASEFSPDELETFLHDLSGLEELHPERPTKSDRKVLKAG